EPAEYAALEDTYSPALHRINQAIRWRAVHPTEEVPPPYEILTKYMNPPEDLIKNAQPHLDKLIAAADVKKVPPKQKGRKRTRQDMEKPLSGLDIDALLGGEKRVRISADNAVPEFKQMLANADAIPVIADAMKQMSTIVRDHIRHSVGDSGYGRAVEGIRVMREEMVELEEPGQYNEFLRDLKEKLLGGELGGDRGEMWWQIRANRLGLIDKRLSHVSDVAEEDAKKFLSSKLDTDLPMR
ncbi:hypothetical protein LTS18_006604, partial [Coniosporium uncinatum]